MTDTELDRRNDEVIGRVSNRRQETNQIDGETCVECGGRGTVLGSDDETATDAPAQRVAISTVPGSYRGPICRSCRTQREPVPPYTSRYRSPVDVPLVPSGPEVVSVREEHPNIRISAGEDIRSSCAGGSGGKGQGVNCPECTYWMDFVCQCGNCPDCCTCAGLDETCNFCGHVGPTRLIPAFAPPPRAAREVR